MTRPFDKHLDSDELNGLVVLPGTSVPDSEQLSGETLREAQRHVESCQDCSRKLQLHKSLQSEISRMRVHKPSRPTPLCIGDAEWVDVAAGLVPDAKARELMKHAAQCGHCGPLLKDAVRMLADEVTPGEEALLASLPSGQPGWQKSLAKTLVSANQGIGAEPGPVREDETQQAETRRAQGFLSFSDSSWWRPAFALAAVALVAVAGWLGYRPLFRLLRPPSAEQLLAQAYTERRTLETRIPGAEYAPMRVERGTGASSLDKPSSLLKAEALIGEKLSKTPNDPLWLQAKARADLLDGNYESAIKTLQQALGSLPDSTSLHTDLASAYFERAEANDRPIDYGNAIESLSRALAKSPDDPVALYNRALACERLFLYTQAKDDWNHYLRVDPNGPWARDARTRLDALQEKLKRHSEIFTEPLLTPQQIAQAGPSEDSAIEEKINSRFEQYLNAAVTDWLPKAYAVSQRANEDSEPLAAALNRIAKIAYRDHGDSWLTDLLTAPRTNAFSAGLAALASSIDTNEKGDYVAASRLAHQATSLFRASGNVAGRLRSEAEEIYASRLLYEGAPCLAELQSVQPVLETRPYYWLRARVALEQVNCYGLAGRLGLQKEILERATQLARDHGYPSLALAGLGFQSDSASSQGEPALGFSLARSGLGIFWSSQVGLMQGYNLYTDLDTAADVLRLPFLQVALWRQATDLIDTHPDIVLRAMAHRWYANAAYLANLPELARAEYQTAGSLFQAAPATAATARDQLDADIWRAKIEIRSGDFLEASKTLSEVAGRLPETRTFPLEINYYSSVADLTLHDNAKSESEKAIRSAIALAEWALASFASEEDRRQWARESAPAYRSLVAWKLRQGDYQTALEFWEWYKGAELRTPSATGSASTLDDASPPDFSNAPALPAPHTVGQSLSSLTDKTVISYAVLPDGVGAWTYDDRGVTFDWITVSAASMQADIENLRRLCSTPDSDLPALRSLARTLYNVLIGPVESRLVPGRALLFELDGPLADLPIDVLLDRHARPLAYSAIEISPGLYRGLSLRPVTPIHPDTPALFVGIPTVAGSGIKSLPDAQKEVAAVAAEFRSPSVLQGTAATLSAIRLALPQSQIFHFAGHAIATVERSGLLLSATDPVSGLPGIIDAKSLDASQLGDLQLTVLSACSTGTEFNPNAGGTESLSQAMFRAGVPNVVATRWNVDSAVTADLMKSFYARLLAGENPRDALHASQLALAAEPALTHPYYWAAFSLQGIN